MRSRPDTMPGTVPRAAPGGSITRVAVLGPDLSDAAGPDMGGDADRRLPETYSVLSARFDLALGADALDEAAALLDRLAQLDPDSSTIHLQRARLHYQRGELGAARGELDAAGRSDAFSWRVLEYRARVVRDLGDRTAARAAIDELLARSPGNRGGLSLRAGEELDAGRPAVR